MVVFDELLALLNLQFFTAFLGQFLSFLLAFARIRRIRLFSVPY